MAESLIKDESTRKTFQAYQSQKCFSLYTPFFKEVIQGCTPTK